MPAITITVQVAGTADEFDRRAMIFAIDKENARRQSLATPENPAVLLPKSTAAERRASYEAVMSYMDTLVHVQNISESDVATLADVRARWPYATDAQRNAVLAALPPLP